MDPSHETLAAFVDGELPPQEMERIAALLETRPDLDAYVRQQEALRATLQNAFAGLRSEPVPERLLQTVRTAPVSPRWRLRAWAASSFGIKPLAAAGAFVAAGLVVGIMLQPAKELSFGASGRLEARGALGAALSTQLASAGYNGSGPRIGISFRDHAGQDCRTFTENAAAGLACRQNGAWVVATLVSQAPTSNGAANNGATYQMAGSEMPGALRDAVAAIIDGTPFDAAAERQARNRGWSK